MDDMEWVEVCSTLIKIPVFVFVSKRETRQRNDHRQCAR